MAVCCQWTPETTKLIGREAFRRDEARRDPRERRAAALSSTKRRRPPPSRLDPLRGPGLDVDVGDLEHGPDRRLWDDAPVFITLQHPSAGSDICHTRVFYLLFLNLRFYLQRAAYDVVDRADGDRSMAGGGSLRARRRSAPSPVLCAPRHRGRCRPASRQRQSGRRPRRARVSGNGGATPGRLTAPGVAVVSARGAAVRQTIAGDLLVGGEPDSVRALHVPRSDRASTGDAASGAR